MLSQLPTAHTSELRGFVEAYEAACEGGSGPPELNTFLPPRNHPLYLAVACELVCIRVERSVAQGGRPDLGEYRARYPELAARPDYWREIVCHEFRLREEAGEEPDPVRYRAEYGVDVRGRSPAGTAADRGPERRVDEGGNTPDVTELTQVTDLGAAGCSPGRYLGRDGSGLESWVPSFRGTPEAAALFGDLFRSAPETAERVAQAATQMPSPGMDFVGFQLVREIGRGAFSRVFLARQSDLADRFVVLKVATDHFGESQTLAQLQHTNIVPIYSRHAAGSLQAVCMPYLGATTFGDVLSSVRSCDYLPRSGRHLLSTRRPQATVADVPTVVTPSGVTPSGVTRSGDGSTLREPSTGSATPGGRAPAAAVSAAPKLAQAWLDRLADMTYVDAVLTLIGHLADGLAHAHARGILHRDLKPANVLLTDDGEPMLLDFNLSEDTKQAGRAEAAGIGGTLPYMAPEHLRAFRGEPLPVDERSDVYSLGVILYELLTARHPFPFRRGQVCDMLAPMIEDRATAPRLQKYNPDVSPAVESIVRTCMAPDPAHRYQSADALREDIRRQLEHLPLKHAANPCVTERLRKWARRHPRFSSTTTTVCVAAGLFLTTGLVAFGQWEKQQHHLRELALAQKRTNAGEALIQLEKDRQLQLALVHAHDLDVATMARIADHSAAALSPYGIPDSSAWQDTDLYRDLDAADRERLKRNAAEMVVTWAETLLLHSQRVTDPDRRAADLTRAWALNEFAATCLPADECGPEYWVQRAKLAALLGRSAEAERYSRKADGLPMRTARDYYLRGSRALRQLEYSTALPLLKEATRRDPTHLWAWFAQGVCLSHLSQPDAAVSCYSTCLALAPGEQESFFSLLNRSKAYASIGRRDEAAADIDRAVEAARRAPDAEGGLELALAHLQRAAFREQQKNYEAAEEDLTAAMGPPALRLQTMLARARVRDARADVQGARADREAALELTPKDEAGWNDRGLARIDKDPRGALADFEEALKVNARYFPSLQNKAHVLSEHLNKPEESIKVLTQILEWYPDVGHARIGRGVLLARLGKREAAHADATRALARSPNPSTYYQAANIYALTSQKVPADADRVPVLLAVAMLGDFGPEVVDGDPDMDPVRKHADFLRTVRIGRVLLEEIQRQGR